MSVITYVCGDWIDNYGPFADGNPWGRVIHTLECDAKPGIARALSEPGGYLDNEGLAPHRMSDPTQVVDVLKTNLKGGHVGSPGNSQLVGYEVGGRAAWSTTEWLDGGLRQQALENDAAIIAEDYVRDGWTRDEIRWLSGAQIKANAVGTARVRGLLTHNDVSEFLGGTNHWDPGTGFPFSWFLDRIRYHYDRLTNTAPPAEKDWFDMASKQELSELLKPINDRLTRIEEALGEVPEDVLGEKIEGGTGNKLTARSRLLAIQQTGNNIAAMVGAEIGDGVPKSAKKK